jgi:deoxyribodipyrimidine photo-lyase
MARSLPVETRPLAIWWIRRDLRLNDNPALEALLAAGRTALPVFVIDPGLWRPTQVGETRLAFLLGGLHQLNEALHERGSYLIVRKGPPEEALAQLASEQEAHEIYYQEDVSPYSRRRDTRVARRRAGVAELVSVGSPAIRPPGTVVKPDGLPYRTFTPFSRAWKALPGQPGLGLVDPQKAPSRLPAALGTPPGISSQPLPNWPALPADHPFPPGEMAARRRLADFAAEGMAGYAERRDRLDLAGTSGLSPYLRFGMLAPERAYAAARQAAEQAAAAGDLPAQQGAESWTGATTRPISPPGAAGRTGYPIVDAAMRQLAETGWMHNRARMIVASFLTKDLLIDWRWGERYFMQHLLDGDPAANNGGWQWTAGTGTDAAPYFRMFNPASQGQRQVGCRIGQDYPAPIVEHAAARQRALEAYR